jgi:hypothetical protein
MKPIGWDLAECFVQALYYRVSGKYCKTGRLARNAKLEMARMIYSLPVNQVLHGMSDNRSMISWFFRTSSNSSFTIMPWIAIMSSQLLVNSICPERKMILTVWRMSTIRFTPRLPNILSLMVGQMLLGFSMTPSVLIRTAFLPFCLRKASGRAIPRTINRNDDDPLQW